MSAKWQSQCAWTYPHLPLVAVSTGMERGCQQNGSRSAVGRAEFCPELIARDVPALRPGPCRAPHAEGVSLLGGLAAGARGKASVFVADWRREREEAPQGKAPVFVTVCVHSVTTLCDTLQKAL